MNPPLKSVEFAAEHRAADRHDSAVGREIASVQNDLEYLAMEYGNSGELLDSAIFNIQAGLDRLRMHGTLLARAAELREELAKIERLPEELAGDRWEGATGRAHRKLADHMRIVQETAERVIEVDDVA
ncbi:hypothetical protein ABZS53_15345 [Streptomyces sp. NPDC005499]|uniref:hypothetical protein n=1 Tax=Streptomyces sp. NPDC005499 TaxID=3154883 RepID=UPI0033B23EE8